MEHATFGGNQCGTSRTTTSYQMKKGRVVVLDMEMNDVKQKKAHPSIVARYVFI